MKVSRMDRVSFVAAVFIMVVGFYSSNDTAVSCGLLTSCIIGAKLEILKKLEDMK